MKNKMRPFHLAFPVIDINKTIQWYTENLSCKIGRQDKKWVDFDFFGHQISAHLSSEIDVKSSKNIVDKKKIPTRHFGIILGSKDWVQLSKKLKSSNVHFLIEPHVRFKGEIGEQATMFIKDPSGNILEFKSFKNDSMIFKS